LFGFGYALRIRAYGSGFGHRFVFGYALRIRAWVWLRVYGSASGVCLDVGKSIANSGIRDGFGIVQPSGKSGEKRKHCKVSVKELEAGGSSESVCFFC